LLSQSSVISSAVAREISLASESQKSILPIEIEDVQLPNEIRYQLAGIQRAQIDDHEAIVRALTKLGLGSVMPSAAISVPLPVRKNDGRVGVIVRRFEDISPSNDNAWFADGLADELIAMLSGVKLLRVIDRLTSMQRKDASLKDLSEEFSVRYAIGGTVRKHGDQIKITTQLVDIEQGETIWSDSYRGTMDDIFDIQQSVALKAVEGLKITVSLQEQSRIVERDTNSVEAYESYLRADEELNRNTVESAQYAADLYQRTIDLDPSYALAYCGKAFALCGIYRSSDRDPKKLQQADDLISQARSLKPNLAQVHQAASYLYVLLGREEEALTAALEMRRLKPRESIAHFNLGFFYSEVGNTAEAIKSYEAAIELDPDNHQKWANLVNQYMIRGDTEKVRIASERALHVVERFLRLNRGDETAETHRAQFLIGLGRKSEALAAIELLEHRVDIGPRALFNIACYFARIYEFDRAINALERALDSGFKNYEAIESDTDLDPLRQLPAFTVLMRRMIEEHG
jgi:TolB-like protein/Flp pilus assembly protein TadD